MRQREINQIAKTTAKVVAKHSIRAGMKKVGLGVLGGPVAAIAGPLLGRYVYWRLKDKLTEGRVNRRVKAAGKDPKKALAALTIEVKK